MLQITFILSWTWIKCGNLLFTIKHHFIHPANGPYNYFNFQSLLSDVDFQTGYWTRDHAISLAEFWKNVIKHATENTQAIWELMAKIVVCVQYGEPFTSLYKSLYNIWIEHKWSYRRKSWPGHVNAACQSKHFLDLNDPRFASREI